MTQMDPIKRQMMQEMIERAAKDQQKQLAWISNLYQQRLKTLQDTEAKRQEWLKSTTNDDDLSTSNS
jgi:hypothetical protein